jgi:hypothetical protein
MAPIDDRLVRAARRAANAASGAVAPPASERGSAGGGARARAGKPGGASTKKEGRKLALSSRALADLQAWMSDAERQPVAR